MSEKGLFHRLGSHKTFPQTVGSPSAEGHLCAFPLPLQPQMLVLGDRRPFKNSMSKELEDCGEVVEICRHLPLLLTEILCCNPTLAFLP